MDLKEIRELSGISQVKMAELLGMSRSGYIKLEASGELKEIHKLAISKVISDELANNLK